MLEQAAARRIKVVGFDVDGVFTDGGVYIGLVANHPLEFKRFHTQDGLGVKLLRAAEASEVRAKEMEVDELIEVTPDKKLPALIQALEQRGLALDACAYVGDDLADVAVLRAVGLPIAVANAAAEVKAAARCVTAAPGGQGAVREVAELLLKARGEWSALLERYSEVGDVAHPARRAR